MKEESHTFDQFDQFDPIGCVYSIQDIDSDIWLEAKNLTWEEWKKSEGRVPENHSSHCSFMETENIDDCDCYEDQPSDTRLYQDENVEIMLLEETAHVFRSPETWRRAMCSPCCPGQADADSPGEILCYKLPEEYLDLYAIDKFNKE